jgi:hypothetical protein
MTIFHHAVAGDAGPLSPLEPVRIGDYLHSARDLYRVEVVTAEGALIEDCRNGELFDVPLTELLNLEPVRKGDARS